MVTIIDNGEPLVEVDLFCPNFINGLSVVRKKKGDKLLLRLTVAKMLGQASKKLPKSVIFKINDAWRPYEVQKSYYDLFYKRTRKSHPKWGEKRLAKYTSTYVINPDDIKRAGHLTGGAVDVVLCRNGKKLPMQNLRLEDDKRNATLHDQSYSNINFNRKLLFEVMSEAGFVNYPKEYWHYSYGDTMWAETIGSKKAFYGPINK